MTPTSEFPQAPAAPTAPGGAPSWSTPLGAPAAPAPGGAPSFGSPFGAPAFGAPAATPEPALADPGFGEVDSDGFHRIPPFVRQLAKTAPKLLVGEDRLKFYAEQISRLSVAHREQLRAFIEQYVSRMHAMGASDLDMGGPATLGRVWYRVDGEKTPHFELGIGSNDDVDILILNLLSERQIDELWEVQSADFSYQMTGEGGGRKRFRCTTYYDNQHLGVCLRAINEEVRPLDGLGFHPIIQKGVLFSNVRSGLMLVTGVTGSGKSTTLDSVIDANNQDFDGHIVIIAKPLEYVHNPQRCIIRHREVGPDVPSFKIGVSQALRQDPDIIMIGEMRDPETIDAAIEAADTGHKVFSTLHTASAVESLDRIVAEYPPYEQERIRSRLADVLNCVVSQKLPPKIGGGRVLAKEVLWVTASVKAAIYNDNTGEIYQMMWESGRQGMITLEQDLFRLVRERKITPDIGLQYSNNKRRFQQLMQTA
ncbi:type IV pilus twitching motility protein PilT [Rubrivirga sp. IMCC45206]|uniref:type IV pilus twitching motility protein PilT n=1 Tax=Rubrivirga sp. IMCC45206 TaxID=3391614 RepID=UPI003990135C